MELQTYVDDVRDQLLTAAENSGDESRLAAERMTATIDSALRLALLEAVSAAADDITVELAPGSVEVRLRGRDPEFAVTVPNTPSIQPAPPTVPAAAVPAPVDTDDGGTSRITLRLPDLLKGRIEAAAEAEGLSVNGWLVRALTAATSAAVPPPAPTHASGRSFTGWVN